MCKRVESCMKCRFLTLPSCKLVRASTHTQTHTTHTYTHARTHTHIHTCAHTYKNTRTHRYRGAAPVQRALCDGVQETGVSVAYTVFQCDAGPVLAQRTVQVGCYGAGGCIYMLCSHCKLQYLVCLCTCTWYGLVFVWDK